MGPKLEAWIEIKVVGIVGTCIARCIIPLQCAMLTLQCVGNHKTHSVNLVARFHRCSPFSLSRWRQIPTPWVTRVVPLTIACEAVPACRASRCTFQNPCVQTGLPNRCRRQASVQDLVTDAKFVVAPMVSRHACFELNDAARYERALWCICGHVLHVRDANGLWRILHWVTTKAVRGRIILRRPRAAATRFHCTGSIGLQAVGTILVAVLVTDDITRGWLEKVDMPDCAV